MLPLIVLPLAMNLGCGPTRTAGTEGIPKQQLATLHVTRQYDVPMVEVSAIRFDDGEKYKIDGGRDFYLTPGVHHVAVDLATNINSMLKDTPLKDTPFKDLLSFGETKIEGPAGLTTGDLQPGKTYEIRGLAGTVQGMVQGGEMAITQEMATK
jgi:hypothetical protein